MEKHSTYSITYILWTNIVLTALNIFYLLQEVFNTVNKQYQRSLSEHSKQLSCHTVLKQPLSVFAIQTEGIAAV